MSDMLSCAEQPEQFNKIEYDTVYGTKYCITNVLLERYNFAAIYSLLFHFLRQGRILESDTKHIPIIVLNASQGTKCTVSIAIYCESYLRYSHKNLTSISTK